MSDYQFIFISKTGWFAFDASEESGTSQSSAGLNNQSWSSHTNSKQSFLLCEWTLKVHEAATVLWCTQKDAHSLISLLCNVHSCWSRWAVFLNPENTQASAY